MRYTKRALLIFGAGLVLGLVLVAANLAWVGWAASATMATGLALLPAAVVVDWWSHRPWRRARPTRRARTRPPRQAKSSPSRKRRSGGKS
jgi:hypothetical protein